jgi:hypothetical protein
MFNYVQCTHETVILDSWNQVNWTQNWTRVAGDTVIARDA